MSTNSQGQITLDRDGNATADAYGKPLLYAEWAHPGPNNAIVHVSASIVGRLATKEEKIAWGLTPGASDYLVVLQGILHDGSGGYDDLRRGALFGVAQGWGLRIINGGIYPSQDFTDLKPVKDTK